MKYTVFIIASIACLLLVGTNCWASPSEEMNDQLKSRVSDLSAKLAEEKASLQNSDAPETADVEEYLYTALSLVYAAKVYANNDFGADVEPTNEDLTSLVSLGYLPEWPANPVNDWQPMRVLGPSDDYSPGDLCFSLCPDYYATTIAAGKTRLSFDLFIYAPSEGLGTFSSIAQGKYNREWSSVPPDTLYGLSYCVVPDFVTEEVKRKWKEKQAQKHSEQESKP